MSLEEELLESCKSGNLSLVKELVEKGVDIHAQEDSALVWSSESGYLEVVKYLVSVGSDIHARDDYALRLASENGYLEVIKYLKRQIVKERLLEV